MRDFENSIKNNGRDYVWHGCRYDVHINFGSLGKDGVTGSQMMFHMYTHTHTQKYNCLYSTRESADYQLSLATKIVKFSLPPYLVSRDLNYHQVL